jgi:hypothetical protein
LVELTWDVDDYASVNELLGENQAEVWAFLLSFAVIARLPATSYAPLLLLLAADPAARAWRRLRT